MSFVRGESVSVLLNKKPYENSKSYLDFNVRRMKAFLPDCEICIGGASGGRYSKSRAINEAFKASRGSIIIILDCNVLLDYYAVIKTCLIKSWCIPYSRTNNIDIRSSLNLIKEDEKINLNTLDFGMGINIPYCLSEPMDERFYEMNYFNNYTVALKRNMFEEIGGFDEDRSEWNEESMIFHRAMENKFGRPEPIQGHQWVLYENPIIYPNPGMGVNIQRIIPEISDK